MRNRWRAAKPPATTRSSPIHQVERARSETTIRARVGQQHAHHQKGHQGDDGRVDEGHAHLVAQGLASLEIAGEPFHDLVQGAGFLRRLDDGGVIAWEGARVPGQALPQPVAGEDILMHAGQDRAQLVRLLLFQQGGERPFDAEAGGGQGGELAREQGQGQGRHAPVTRTVGAWRIAGRHLLGQQPLLTQTGTHRAGMISLQFATMARALGVHRHIAPGRHLGTLALRSAPPGEVERRFGRPRAALTSPPV
jgi:hypothetical protein